MPSSPASWSASSAKKRPRSHNPLQWLNDKFHSYIEDRRREPRGDVLTELAQAKYEDGSTPDIDDVMNLSTFLFAAGTETTTKLVSSAMRVIAENPEYESYLREDRGRIPAFLEETLRMESPVKSHFRMARTSTTIGDTEIPAGTTVMLLPGACNRDARKFDDPDTFRPDRRNVREQIAFIRGVHSCPGAPLAPDRGPHLGEPDPGPDDRLQGFRRTPRSAGGAAATATSRRSSCVGWPNCTWSSSRTRKPVHIATLFT